MRLNSKVYDVLKWICLIAIPSLTTLAAVVLKTWNLCSVDVINAIVTTSTAVAACIGGLIGISTIEYEKKG